MKCFVRVWAVVVFSAALASCHTTGYLGTEAAKAGRYAEAEPLLLQAIREGDEPGVAWTNLGVIYSRTNRPKQATEAVIMGARYGDSNAQSALVKAGRPVPPADLAPKTMSDAQLLLMMGGSLAQGWNAGARTPASPPMPITCNSTRFHSGDYTTTCQ